VNEPASPTGHQYEIVHGATRAIVVEVGGGLRTLVVDGRDVLDGYTDQEFCPGGRGQVLMPWPNRLDHGRYEWDGRTHQASWSEPELMNAIHGLVRFASWDCVSAQPTRLELAHILWPSPGYPFSLELRLTYTLDGDGLTVQTGAKNIGADPAPFGSGQHPYLRPSSGSVVDDCMLSIAARRYLPTDDRGLPIGRESVAETAYDFRSSRHIGGDVLDLGFTDLIRDDDGRAWVEVTEPGAERVALWVDESYRYLQVYTGDTLPDASRRRRGLAVEPMTCPANAFATGTDVWRIDPGETRTATWGLVIGERSGR
jgi:aldose 1-epimerase